MLEYPQPLAASAVTKSAHGAERLQELALLPQLATDDRAFCACARAPGNAGASIDARAATDRANCMIGLALLVRWPCSSLNGIVEIDSSGSIGRERNDNQGRSARRKAMPRGKAFRGPSWRAFDMAQSASHLSKRRRNDRRTTDEAHGSPAYQRCLA